MITVLAKRATNWLIRNDAISEDERELYEYAAYNLIFTSIPLAVFLVICLCTGNFLNGGTLLITVLAIRRYAGGYHAKTPLVCTMCSCGMLAVCLFLSLVAPNGIIIKCSVAVSVIILWILSPIDSENRRLDKEEKFACKLKTRVRTAFFCTLYILFSMLRYTQIAVSIALGIDVAAFMLVLCIRQILPKQGHR